MNIAFCQELYLKPQLNKMALWRVVDAQMWVGCQEGSWMKMACSILFAVVTSKMDGQTMNTGSSVKAYIPS